MCYNKSALKVFSCADLILAKAFEGDGKICLITQLNIFSMHFLFFSFIGPKVPRFTLHNSSSRKKLNVCFPLFIDSLISPFILFHVFNLGFGSFKSGNLTKPSIIVAIIPFVL